MTPPNGATMAARELGDFCVTEAGTIAHALVDLTLRGPTMPADVADHHRKTLARFRALATRYETARRIEQDAHRKGKRHA